MKKIGWTLVILSLFASQTANATTTYVPVNVPPPNQLAVDNQYFDMSANGLEEFMETLQLENPTAHRALSPSFNKIQKASSTSKIISYGLGGGGTVVMLVGLTQLESSDPSTATLSMVGMTVSLVGILVGAAIAPGRKDFMKFVNHHNRVRPETPLRIQLGFLRGTDAPGAMLAMRL